MTPEEPYDSHYIFAVHDGAEIIDGKVYYPTLLRINLNTYDMWHIVTSMIAHLRHTPEISGQFILTGTLQQKEEE